MVTFAVFAAGFGWQQIARYRHGGTSLELAFGCGSFVVALGCIVYLARSPYLRRKP